VLNNQSSLVQAPLDAAVGQRLMLAQPSSHFIDAWYWNKNLLFEFRSSHYRCREMMRTSETGR